MPNDFLIKLFEHNNWANQQIIQACSTLSDAQLDAEPLVPVKGSIRLTLLHLVTAQQGYFNIFTVPVAERSQVQLDFADLADSARQSGESFLALLRGERQPLPGRLQTRDGFYVEPWVLIVQVINHATEHREQIKHLLSALGLTSPEIDAWIYGESLKALVPVAGG